MTDAKQANYISLLSRDINIFLLIEMKNQSLHSSSDLSLACIERVQHAVLETGDIRFRLAN